MKVQPIDALRQILEAAGETPSRAAEVRFEGTDPVLPTRFLMATAGAAALGAVGLAAANLWERKTGRRQQVAIRLRNAAMALRSNMYLALDGAPVSGIWDDISGFFATGDGHWIQLHCNFPHHRDGVLRVLGCANSRNEVAAAVATWPGAELDRRLADEGLCAALVRTSEEWAALPQAAAIAGLPLLEIIRFASSSPQPLPDSERPLGGVRVLDLTRVIAGPVAGRTLAEHGADVLRVAAPSLPFVETLVMDTGHGKLSAHIDLDAEGGRQTLRDLAVDCDVFSQAYRPGSLEARGFGPTELAAIRPGIVYVTLSAYGHEGPWALRRGYDSLVQSASGIAHENGGGRPQHLPGQALDYVSGYLAAFGAMTALERRAREGGSYLVRVSLAQTGKWIGNLGRLDAKTALPADPAMADVADLVTETATPWGRLAHLAPVLGLSETTPDWRRPVVPLGSHPPAWPLAGQ